MHIEAKRYLPGQYSMRIKASNPPVGNGDTCESKYLTIFLWLPSRLCEHIGSIKKAILRDKEGDVP